MHMLRELELTAGMWGDLVLLQLQARACLLQYAGEWRWLLVTSS